MNEYTIYKNGCHGIAVEATTRPIIEGYCVYGESVMAETALEALSYFPELTSEYNIAFKYKDHTLPIEKVLTFVRRFVIYGLALFGFSVLILAFLRGVNG